MTPIAVGCESPPFESRRNSSRRTQARLTARAVFVATLIAFTYVALITTP
jgi:hypothetical protein